MQDKVEDIIELLQQGRQPEDVARELGVGLDLVLELAAVSEADASLDFDEMDW